ncbi:MAG TPA: molybdopterin-dependent oxidoreductase, partial [Acidobacteriota bacterium]|nr:molybdopterin-dependent oxidoreductase [Acidobacteriota bacterium]
TDQENALPYALTQGLDGLPALDWSGSDLVLSFGFDLFEDGPAPIHAISALIGTRETQERARLLYAGTRCSPSASKADLFVPVRPGTLGALALGVAHVLVREGRYDSRFVAEHTFGFEDGRLDGSETLGFRRLLLERYYPDRIAQICGCPAASIVRLARRFAQASYPLAIAGGEAVEGTNATWNVMAVHSLNALIGAFGRPGGVLPRPSLPLSPLPGSAETGTVPPTPLSPDGEERGLLGSEPLEAFSKAVLDGSQAVEVLFVIGDDPVRRQPSGSLLAQALKKIPVVVSLTPFLDETGRYADWVLPTPVPLESWQDSTTPSFSALSVLGIARPVIEPLYESRHAGDILLELGSRAALADNSLPWKSYSQYLRDRLNGLARSGQGTLISGSFEESWRRFLEERGWRFLQHQGIDEFWPDLLRQSGWWNSPRFQGDWTRLFPSPSGRYEFFSQQLYRKLLEYGGGLSSSAGAEAALNRARQTLGLQGEVEELCLPHYEPPQQTGQGELILIPFRPVTSRGRLATASPMVMEMFGHSVLAGWQTWAELGPQTATGLDLEEGDLVALETDRGQIEAVVRIQAGAASEAVHVPLGLGWVPALPSEAAGANPCKILLPAHDPISGAFSRCSTRVRIRLLRRRPYGGPAPHDSGGRT